MSLHKYTFTTNDYQDIAEVLNMRLIDSSEELDELDTLDKTNIIQLDKNAKKYINEFIEKKCQLLGLYSPTQKYIYRCNCNRIGISSIANFRAIQKCSRLCGQITTREIKHFMIENDCEPLFTYYKGNRHSYKFQCICGEIDNKKWPTYQQIPRCTNASCGGHKKKLNIKNVQEYFKTFNYTLTSTEYKGCMDNLTYKCPNKHIGITTFNRFSNGHRCPECDRLSRMVSTDNILILLKKLNYTYINETVNMDEHKLTYQCSKKHINNVVARNINKDTWQGCPTCYIISTRNKYDDVYDLFEKYKCTLLDTEYISNYTLMKYMCLCGNTAQITYKDFCRGRRCLNCAPERRKVTNLKIYNCENPFQNEAVKLKSMQTNIKKYGVPHAMQNVTIFNKQLINSFKRKIFTFPSGKQVFVQGYEPLALRDLIKRGFKEDDIIVNPQYMPAIFYSDPHTYKTRRYYPDIYVKSEKWFVEVKSQYTYDIAREVNEAKCLAVCELNYSIELQIYDGKECISARAYYNIETKQ